MKRLGQISAILFGISLLIHAYSLVMYLFIANPVEPPRIVWILHIGAFICLFPPSFARWKTLESLYKSGRPVDTAADGEFYFRGVYFPFKRFLKAYVIVIFVATFTGWKPEINSLLAFSMAWVAVYYISWQMITYDLNHDESAHEAA